MSEIMQRALETERNKLNAQLGHAAVYEKLSKRLGESPNLESWQMNALVNIVGEFAQIARELGQLDVLLDDKR